ncbi:MAG: lysine--tRNA ligase [Pseudomonadaceae bacterium]|nr:lysine--tRNA ligase [Pseudomonadaceae bacterium]
MTDDNDIIRGRRDKLSRWRSGGQAFPNTFRRDDLAADLDATHAEHDKQQLEELAVQAKVAGRIVLKRAMGKASFLTLADPSGRIQCYLRKDALGDAAYEQFNDLFDIGDIIGVEGTVMRTNKGELTVAASGIELLTKALRPLPEKHAGLTDTETKYRQRYVDLIVNDESRQVFLTRSKIIAFIRHFFSERGFLEVETPMMHPIPGGATARPFVTHHNALDMDLYLRIAPELYLKRLVVGGFERVFEINRSFRNEGLSTRHNPEFTMLEFYQAFADYEDLMDLTESLLQGLVESVLGGTELNYQGDSISFANRFRRVTMAAAVADALSISESDASELASLKAALAERNLSLPGDTAGELLNEAFEELVEASLQQPTFITQYPAEVSPLARRNTDNPAVTDRFELFIGGREVANAFSELNDPEDQAERFAAQAAKASSGDNEAMHFDADYIRALEVGLPPTAGEGIGIDRLVMLLTNSASIRDVLLFPHMRAEASAAGDTDSGEG